MVIILPFYELTGKGISHDKHNFFRPASKVHRRNIAFELTHTGNGYVYGACPTQAIGSVL